MSDRLVRWFSFLLAAAGTVGFVWLAVRFLLPWTAPFLAAWALAALLEAPVGFLARHGWRRGAAAGLCTLLALGLLLWALSALVWKGVGALTDFVQQLPALMDALQDRLNALESTLEAGIRSAPPGSSSSPSSSLRMNSSAASVRSSLMLPGASARIAAACRSSAGERSMPRPARML